MYLCHSCSAAFEEPEDDRCPECGIEVSEYNEDTEPTAEIVTTLRAEASELAAEVAELRTAIRKMIAAWNTGNRRLIAEEMVALSESLGETHG